MISIGEIVYRILENPLLRAVKKSDIVTHVKTVIELVGVPGLKQDKFITLNINDFRAPLPEDFLERVSVRILNGNEKIVLTHDTNNSGQFNNVAYGVSDDPDTLYTHKIVNGFIYTDFREGIVELTYKAYYTDDKGWPMIPRNESLVKAIDYYIRARYYEILADQNAQFERAYERAHGQYCWYVAQATSSLLTLDPVEAQALGEALVRMVPLRDNFYTDNKYSGQPERLNKVIW